MFDSDDSPHKKSSDYPCVSVLLHSTLTGVFSNNS